MSVLPVYLKASEVATMLQLDPKSVYRLAANDSSFPATRIGGSIRFERDAILRYLEEKTQGSRRRRPAAA